MTSQQPKVAGHKPPPCWRPGCAAKAVPGSSDHEQLGGRGLTALAQHFGQGFRIGDGHICPADMLNRAQDSILSACPELSYFKGSSTLKQLQLCGFLPFLLALVLVWPHSVPGQRAKIVRLTLES